MQTNLRATHSVGANTREWMIWPDSSPALRSQGIFLVGWSEARLGFNFVRPDCPMAQILGCRSGWGLVWLDGRWQRLEPGQAYLTPAGADNAYQAVSETVWEVVWITYVAAGPLGFGSARKVAVDLNLLYQAVRGLYGELTQAAHPEALADWSRLVGYYGRWVAHVDQLAGDERLRQLWAVVVAEPGEAWSLVALAERVGMSGENLRRLCQREHQCSPMEYVTQLRMRHAASLLASERYSVAEVSERVGYNNPFAFSTAFKRVIGQPPSRFRGGRGQTESRVESVPDGTSITNTP